MELLDFVFDSTYQIIYEGSSFPKEIKNKSVYSEFADEIKKPYKDLLGCSIRHILIFTYLLNDFLTNNFLKDPYDVDNKDNSLDKQFLFKKYQANLMKKETILLTNYLANALFCNVIDNLTFKVYLDKKLNELGSHLNSNLIYESFKNLDKNNLIPESIDKKSPLYLSLRFNVLEWQAKMFIKQYGYHNSFNFLRAIAHQNKNTYAKVNLFNADTKLLLNDYKDYSETPYENLLAFNGKCPLRNDEVITKGYAFSYSLAFEKMINKLDIDSYKNCAFYMDEISPLYIEVSNKFKDGKMDVIVKPNKDFYLLNKQRVLYNLDNTFLYEALPSDLLSVLSNKVSYFFVTINCSNFASLRNSPDNFLRITEKDIDDGYVNGLSTLNSICDFVEVDGCIIYYLPTLSKAETDRVIVNFLNNHPNFKLEDKHQFFPFNEEETTLYYAVLRKCF